MAASVACMTASQAFSAASRTRRGSLVAYPTPASSRARARKLFAISWSVLGPEEAATRSPGALKLLKIAGDFSALSHGCLGGAESYRLRLVVLVGLCPRRGRLLLPRLGGPAEIGIGGAQRVAVVTEFRSPTLARRRRISRCHFGEPPGPRR